MTGVRETGLCVTRAREPVRHKNIEDLIRSGKDGVSGTDPLRETNRTCRPRMSKTPGDTERRDVVDTEDEQRN